MNTRPSGKRRQYQGFRALQFMPKNYLAYFQGLFILENTK